MSSRTDYPPYLHANPAARETAAFVLTLATFACRSLPACCDDVTVAGLIARLKQYPPEALCLGTFRLADDFLSIDDSLSGEEIAEAMRICDRCHEACVGFNWDTLQFAINHEKER